MRLGIFQLAWRWLLVFSLAVAPWPPAAWAGAGELVGSAVAVQLDDMPCEDDCCDAADCDAAHCVIVHAALEVPALPAPPAAAPRQAPAARNVRAFAALPLPVPLRPPIA
jgi:hypothetical protein